MDKSKIPLQLIENFKKELGAFFIGAGLSIPAGFPTWKELIQELIGEAKKLKYVSSSKIADYEKILDDNSKFLFLAEDLKIELGTKYYDYMERRFREHNSNPTVIHELLVNIKTDLMITINYDNLLEKAYNKVNGEYPNAFTYVQAKEAANNFWKRNFFILKAHGDAKQDVNSLILSQKDYRNVLYREFGYRSLLQAIFTTKSILFLGVSFSDPEFNQLLDYLHYSYHGGGPTHYLLIEEEKMNGTLSRRYMDDFKIETIEYSNKAKDHKEIESFLNLLETLIKT
jgi:hypothetical protein